MEDNYFKEFFQKLAVSEETIQEQINKEIKNVEGFCKTIVIPDVGISSEELNRQMLIVSQIIQKQSEIELLNDLKRIYDSNGKLEDCLQEVQELATNPKDYLPDIPSLKKKIKYCKNPMERKSLERQLNAAYKEMKRKR